MLANKWLVDPKARRHQSPAYQPKFDVSGGPHINYDLCDGCEACYRYCPSDVFGWDKESNRPYIAHPWECHFCDACELECLELAIDVRPPLQTRIEFDLM